MSHRYRCNRAVCRARVTLSKRKELYVREPTCKHCGGKLHSVEKERRRDSRKHTCGCDGLHHPHRRGCKWCNYYKGVYTNEELQERHCI